MDESLTIIEMSLAMQDLDFVYISSGRGFVLVRFVASFKCAHNVMYKYEVFHLYDLLLAEIRAEHCEKFGTSIYVFIIH